MPGASLNAQLLPLQAAAPPQPACAALPQSIPPAALVPTSAPSPAMLAALQPPPSTPAEKAAMETRLMATLLAHSNDIFICHRLQRDGALLAEFVSPSVHRVLGWAPDALLGRDWREVCHPDDAPLLRDAVAAVMAPGAAEPCTYVLYRARTAQEGACVWLHAQLCRHTPADGSGEPRLLAMARSAAGHKTREEALRGFLLVTSHDLRTPCHGVVVAAQLLAERPAIAADAEAASLVDAVLSSCRLMLGVITNVLTMKDIQAGGRAEAARMHSLPPVRFEPRALLAGALQTCRLGCGLAPSRLRWDGAADGAALPPAVEGDAERAALILQNVLVYALHAGGAAPLDIRLSFAEGALQLAVRDGACAELRAPEERERAVFATDSCAQLGMFVARFFARAAGGDVTADAEEQGGGAALHVRLPVRVADPLPEPATPKSPAAQASPSLGKRAALRGNASVGAQRVSYDSSRPATAQPQGAAAAAPTLPRCLLVDDHELNLRLVKRLLERHGFEVRCCIVTHASSVSHRRPCISF